VSTLDPALVRGLSAIEPYSIMADLTSTMDEALKGATRS